MKHGGSPVCKFACVVTCHVMSCHVMPMVSIAAPCRVALPAAGGAAVGDGQCRSFPLRGVLGNHSPKSNSLFLNFEKCIRDTPAAFLPTGFRFDRPQGAGAIDYEHPFEFRSGVFTKSKASS